MLTVVAWGIGRTLCCAILKASPARLPGRTYISIPASPGKKDQNMNTFSELSDITRGGQ